MYTILYECIFSFLLVFYLEVEFLGHVWLYVYVLEKGPAFSKEAVTFSFPLAIYEGSSFLRQISQPSFQISQAALPQASVVAAGRLSVAADPVAWAPVLVIHCAPWGLSSDTHSNKAVLRNSHEKSEAGLKFLQKFLLKNCFLWKLPIYFLLSFFILIPQFEFLSDICDHPTPELS